jgi:uncharacterized protein
MSTLCAKADKALLPEGADNYRDGTATMTDFQALDQYLSSDDSPEDCMLLSDLDGFLTGVLCSPELIPPSEWLPIAMGQAELNVPPEIITLLMERYNEIVAALNTEPPLLEPIFWQAKEGHVIAIDWCEGFMEAVALQRGGWDELLQSPEGREWVFPILAHLVDDSGEPLIGTAEEQIDAVLDAAAEMIPKTAPLIFTFWQAKRSPHMPS